MAPPTLKKPETASVLRFRCDGVNYICDLQDVPLSVERELYVAAQITPQQAVSALVGGARFGIAAMIYLARRQAGEVVAYQTVEDGLWQAMRRTSIEDFDLAILTDDDEEADRPPA